METITIRKELRIATVTLNRPEKRNALSPQMVSELSIAFDQLSADEDVRLVVLKGEGPAFCAGADLAYLKQMQNFSYEENLADSNRLRDLFLKMYRFPKVLIAQVHGPALAGGCGLVTVCDFAVASREATFGFTEVRIGFVPALVMVFLLKKLGEAHTRNLLLSGDLITADKAMAMGLITSLCEPGDLERITSEFSGRLLKNNSFESLMATKQLLTALNKTSLEESLSYAATMNAKARETADCIRGISAFLNKEKIIW